ncbi:HAD family hydrolase [Chromohalobacter canadensis]|uniref:HAD-IA family hydrolase n=1 Tax=Chromohalobacter canadensis TaxID=141389 RepID=A0ABZ0YE68_9GAMM|nr:HAD-IA family hydrolase [Chromohalobacter canadensis]MCK0769600.1 HAD-IA family hydrolase [Chromohalobacter canadensis]MCT8468864.1 HAD-IA family hydrolase [Chromohalobacter canadensis]MCT8472946.1 HAD-IA family hydrolase [Chromohalobacter canadensis]MCT8500398.1 HAD-IA family hydrolase [Chromohalobacter canadensis]WQH10380.1 HAD-IA family hydrolase [Chromohalobacter canadensis]
MSHPLCLLFDCDGTLVDSEPLLADVMANVLTRAGLPFAASQYMEEFRGVRFANIVAELERRFGALNDATRDAAEAELRHTMQARMSTELQPIPGIREALDQLTEHPRCVASNGPEHKIRRALDSTGLRAYFGDRLYSGYTIERWKPDPELFLHAARAMGVTPEHCVVIDDADVGVAAGLAAGMRTIHINRFPERETTPEGAIALHHMRDLPSAVARLEQLEAVLH